MSERVGHCSASSIATFKTCPQKYRISYVEGLRQTPEPAPFRFGTNWHAGQAVLETGGTLEAALEAATAEYEVCPDWADPIDWAVECETLRAGLAAYAWL